MRDIAIIIGKIGISEGFIPFTIRYPKIAILFNVFGSAFVFATLAYGFWLLFSPIKKVFVKEYHINYLENLKNKF